MTPFRHLALFMILMLAGCSGYSFGEGGTSVLPQQYQTLAMGGVSNPTTLAWLEPRVRMLLRDELTNRGATHWVDEKSAADAVISIDIIRYYRPTSVAGESDETLRSTAIFNFRATITSTTDESVIWQSGEISQTWPFFSGDETQADQEVTTLGIRRLADRMSENY